MIKNLYVFKKTAWHVKFFIWLYDTDPTTTFRTMCPYFWSLVFTFIFFPLLILIKFLGKKGNLFLNRLEAYKRNKKDKLEKAFFEKANNPNISPEEAYRLYYSKCWSNYNYTLSYDLEETIYKLVTLHKKYLQALIKEREEKKERVL